MRATVDEIPAPHAIDVTRVGRRSGLVEELLAEAVLGLRERAVGVAIDREEERLEHGPERRAAVAGVEGGSTDCSFVVTGLPDHVAGKALSSILPYQNVAVSRGGAGTHINVLLGIDGDHDVGNASLE